MSMPGRNYEQTDTKYRYGFNGQEKSDEIFEGSTTALFWEYDSRTGRRWNVDPVEKVWESPYLCFSGNPVLLSDVNGDDADDNGGGKKKKKHKKNAKKPSKPITTSKTIEEVKPIKLGTELKMEEPWEKDKKDKEYINDQIGTSFIQTDNTTGRKLRLTISSIEITNPDGTVVGADNGVGQAGTLESFAPVWGSGRNAIDAFQNGRYISGVFNTLGAVSDVFLISSLSKGFTKGGISALSLGESPWSKAPWKSGLSYRSHYLESGFAEAKAPLHHWLLNQNQGVGRNISGAIKNQMFNLMPMKATSINGVLYSANQIHNALHGKGKLIFTNFQKLYYGTPLWFKTGIISTSSRISNEIGVKFNF